MFEESLPYPRRPDHNADEHLQQQVALLQRFFKNSKALWNSSEMNVFRKIVLIRNDLFTLLQELEPLWKSA